MIFCRRPKDARIHYNRYKWHLLRHKEDGIFLCGMKKIDFKHQFGIEEDEFEYAFTIPTIRLKVMGRSSRRDNICSICASQIPEAVKDIINDDSDYIERTNYNGACIDDD